MRLRSSFGWRHTFVTACVGYRSRAGPGLLYPAIVADLGPQNFVAEALARSNQLSRRVNDWLAINQRRVNEITEQIREPVRIATAWIEANRSQIEAFLKGLDALNRHVEEIEAQWKAAGLGYLVSPLGFGEHLFLTLYASRVTPTSSLSSWRLLSPTRGSSRRCARHLTKLTSLPTFRAVTFSTACGTWVSATSSTPGHP